VLDVENSQTTFIQFNLSSIPASYTCADMTQATLKLYVNAVTAPGSFNVDYVNGTWTESTITADNAPALGTTIAASVPPVTADKRLTETGIRFLETVIHHRFDRYSSSARSMCSELFESGVMYQFEILTARTNSQMPRAIMVQSIRLKPIIFSIVGLDCLSSLARNRHHT